MNKKITRIFAESNSLTLTWVLNNICTNHCDYCPPVLHSGINHNYDWEVAKQFLNRLFDRYPKIVVSVTGGEPTVSPFFPELVRTFYDRGHAVGLTTNGVRPVRYWADIAPYLSYVSFSYHPSYHDDEFIDKLVYCSQYTSVTARIMMDSRYWDKATEMFEKCSNIASIRTVAIRIIPERSFRHVGDDYSEEQLQWFVDHPLVKEKEYRYQNSPLYKNSSPLVFSVFEGEEKPVLIDASYINSTKQNSFVGWACNIGVESLFIDHMGNIKKGNCLQGGILFNIVDHEINDLPLTGEICLQDACDCEADIRITKFPVFDKFDPRIVDVVNNRKVLDEKEYTIKFDKFIKK